MVCRQCFLNATSPNLQKDKQGRSGEGDLTEICGSGVVLVLLDSGRCLWVLLLSQWWLIRGAHSTHFKFQSWCLKKASSPSWRRWRGIAVGGLVQRSRLWEFDAVGVGAGSELWHSCGKLWECYRCRKVALWGPGTHKKKKKNPKLTQKSPNPACYLDSSGGP